MLRKAILAMVVTACKDSPFYQTFFAAMLLQAYTYLHLQFRPYRSDTQQRRQNSADGVDSKTMNGLVSVEELHKIKRQKALQALETMSLCITTITLSGAVMFFSHPPPSWGELSRLYSEGGQRERMGAWEGVPLGVSVMLFALNIILLLRFTMAFVNTFLEHRRTIVKELSKSTGLTRLVSSRSSPVASTSPRQKGDECNSNGSWIIHWIRSFAQPPVAPPLRSQPRELASVSALEIELMDSPISSCSSVAPNVVANPIFENTDRVLTSSSNPLIVRDDDAERSIGEGSGDPPVV